LQEINPDDAAVRLLSEFSASNSSWNSEDLVSMISIEERPAWGTRIINEELKFEFEPCEVEEREEHNLRDSIS